MCVNKIPIISFFSGGGFFDMGFEQAGFHVVFSNEYDPDFAKLYEAGMTSWASRELMTDRLYSISSQKSLVDLPPSEIETKAFPYGKPSLWGIIGGPPCQDFTMNGQRTGFDGERGKMTIIFFSRIKKMRPAFFVMENVTGLIRNKDSKTILENIVNNHCKHDYYMDSFILNALDYGVPQNRERVFLIGLRKDLFIPPLKEVFETNLFDMNFSKPKPKFTNAKKIYKWPKMNPFGQTPIKPEDLPDELCVNQILISESDRKNKTHNINEFFPFHKNPEERKKIQEGDTCRQSFKRLHRYRYSPTTCYGNNEVHLHPYENRRLSVREALRIQGVSDNYILPPDISMSKKFKLIGNGVPVPLSKALAESLISYIEKYIIE